MIGKTVVHGRGGGGVGGGRHQGLGASEEGRDKLGKNTGINEHNIGSSPLDQLVKGNERVRVHVKNHVQLYTIYNLHSLNDSPWASTL